MLPSLSKLAVRTVYGDQTDKEEEQMYIVYPYNASETIPNYLEFAIDPKYVWKQTSAQDNSKPLTTQLRLSLIKTIVKYILETSLPLGNQVYLNQMLSPDWRLTKPSRQLVYYQTSTDVYPEWKNLDGQLSIDEDPEEGDSYVFPFDWLTYEWMQLAPDYRAFCLANMVHRYLPSSAWLGLSADLYNLCGSNRECYLQNIDEVNRTVSERLLSKLLVNEEQSKQSEPLNYIFFRSWVNAAFFAVDPTAWSVEWVETAIFDMMPGLMAAPRVTVTQYDRRFVENLRKILEKAASPNAPQYQQNLKEYERMMRGAHLPTRGSKRAR